MPGLPVEGFPPAGLGVKQMAEDEKGRTFFEWMALIIKLLGALSTLLAVLAELFR